jgi:hypothetical protein
VTSKRAVVLFATALHLGASSIARADPPAAPETMSRHFVDVVIAGDPEEAGAAERSLRELLRRVGLELRVTTVEKLPSDPGASAPDAAVRAWIDLRADNGALVEVADARAERTFERRLVAQEGSRAVLIEDVVHVVQAAAESIASDAPPPPPPKPEPPPVAVVVPPPAVQPPYVAPDMTPIRAEPTPWSLAVAGFFTTAPYAHDSGAVLGAGAGLRFDSGRFALWGFGAYHARFGDDAPPVALHASVWSVRLVPTFELVDASGFLLEAGAGAGVDIFSLTPGVTSSDVTMLDANRTEASPILTALVAAHVQLGSSARAFLAGTVDWDLDPRRYVVSSTGMSSPLLTPLTVRPGVALGLSFDVVHAEGRR